MRTHAETPPSWLRLRYWSALILLASAFLLGNTGGNSSSAALGYFEALDLADEVVIGRVLARDSSAASVRLKVQVDSHLKAGGFARVVEVELPAANSARERAFLADLQPAARVMLFLEEGPKGFALVGGFSTALVIESAATARTLSGEELSWRSLEALLRAETMLPAPAAAGALLIERSIEDLSSEADAIVTGLVISIDTSLTGSGSIETEVVVKVSANLKGEDSEQITLTLPGGRVGDLEQFEGGVPSFLIGETVLVFLRESSGSASLTSLWQSKYTLVGEEAIQVETGKRLGLSEMEDKVGRGVGEHVTIPDAAEVLSAPFVVWTNCSWNTADLPLEFYVNPANPGTGGSTGTDFIRFAVQSYIAWQQLSDSHFTAVYMGTTTRSGTFSVGDGLNDFRWADLDAFGTGVLGVNTCWVSSGFRTDSDSRLDNTGFTWDMDGSNGISSGTYSAEGVMEHELGHGLGLSHSAEVCDGSPSTP